jgi:orotidine-5'-phosphate decarboxylase
MSRDFKKLLDRNWEGKKFLCIGLDPDYQKIPEAARKAGIRETFVSFDRTIVDATKDIVCAYKPNTAFYEAHGDEGVAALRETCLYILERAPDAVVILDAKRADIGNTNRGYADLAFEYLQADAITLHPYLGAEALQPFLERKDKGAFILCRTSNPGSREFQELVVDGEPLYMRVAKNVADEWNAEGNCGLVVGATYPEELTNVRKMAPRLPILIPGVGAQGGDLSNAVSAAKDERGGFILSVSRSILYASSGSDFAEAARAKAQEIHEAIELLV